MRTAKTPPTPTADTSPLSATEKWTASLGSLLLWAIVAASALYWLLSAPRIGSDTSAAPVPQHLHSNPQQLARLLGAAATNSNTPTSTDTPTVADRVQLRGVIAQNDQQGVAILSIDNAAFQPYKSGQDVLDGWQVQSVSGRTATLTKGKQSFSVELPENTNTTDTENTSTLERYPTAHTAAPVTPPPNPPAVVHTPQPVTAPQNEPIAEPTEFDARTISPNTPNSDPALQAAIEAAHRQDSKPRRSGFFRR